jgi:putative RecB family exonuclease
MPRKKQASRANPGPPTEKAEKVARFSPTRISLYLFCPRAYFLYYHRSLRWGGLTPGHAFGGSLHRTLQAFHERGGADRVSLEELLDHLRERWSEAGYSSAEEAAAHLAAGEVMLQQYYEAAPQLGRETLWTEKTVQHRYDQFILFGKIDRLDRRPDGALEVVDYKSGRLTVTEEEVRDNLALKIYQLLVARQNPGVPVYTGILCLRSGATASVLRTAEELAQIEREIESTVDQILQDEEMKALPGEQCRECVYPRVCPPGRRWLALNPMTGTR